MAHRYVIRPEEIPRIVGNMMRHNTINHIEEFNLPPKKLCFNEIVLLTGQLAQLSIDICFLHVNNDSLHQDQSLIMLADRAVKIINTLEAYFNLELDLDILRAIQATRHVNFIKIFLSKLHHDQATYQDVDRFIDRPIRSLDDSDDD